MEEHRAWLSELDVTAFDSGPYAHYAEELRAQGIEIKTLQELSGEPERDRKLYELHCEVAADVIAPEPFARPTFEEFCTTLHSDPKIIPEAYFVAVAEGEYVGQSVFWQDHLRSPRPLARAPSDRRRSGVLADGRTLLRGSKSLGGC